MGWSELLLIAIVALIVVGPKDLPVMFRALGKFTAKIRRMGREFSDAIYEAGEAGALQEDLQKLSDPMSSGLNSLNEAAEKFENWTPNIAEKTIGPNTAKLIQKRAEHKRKMDQRAAEIVKERREKARKDTKSPKAASVEPAKHAGAKAKKSAAPKSAASKSTTKGAARPKSQKAPAPDAPAFDSKSNARPAKAAKQGAKSALKSASPAAPVSEPKKGAATKPRRKTSPKRPASTQAPDA